MSKDELIVLIKENLINKNGKIIPKKSNMDFLKANCPEIYSGILEHTCFLPEDVFVSERIYVILNDVCEIPLCETCGNKTVFNKMAKKYMPCCSRKCYISKLEIAGKQKKDEKTEELEQKIFDDVEKYKNLDRNQFISEIKEKLFYRNGKMISFNRETLECTYPGIYARLIKGTEFLPSDSVPAEIVYCFLNNLSALPRCKICNGTVGFLEFKKGYSICCSEKCYRTDPEHEELRKKKCLEKYGVEHYLQSEEVKAKSRKTVFDKHGVEFICATKEFKEKTKISNLFKYGVEHTSQSKEVQDKKKQKCFTESGVEYYNQKHIPKESMSILKDKGRLSDLYKEYTIEQISKDLKVSFGCVQNYLLKYDIERRVKITQSAAEKEIRDFINIKNIIECSHKIIYPLEIDLYLPDYNLAIEFDGIYHHGAYDKKSDLKHQTYHLNKTNECLQQGISLFHVFENEWMDFTKRSIWKSLINRKLNRCTEIDLRDCQIQEVPECEALPFMDENHLAGETAYEVCYGLYNHGGLVSLMAFDESLSYDYQYEMLRFCNKNHLHVAHSEKLLFDYFVKKYNPSSIVSYANRRFDFGEAQKSIGMEFIENTDPDYFYFKGGYSLKDKNLYDDMDLSQTLKKFNPELSQTENLFQHGFRRIYDSGNAVYSWTA